MSADTFHAAIERQMRKRNLVDWRDLTNCVKTCLTEPRHAPVVIDMRPEDFYDIKLTNRRNLSVSLYIFLLTLRIYRRAISICGRQVTPAFCSCRKVFLSRI